MLKVTCSHVNIITYLWLLSSSNLFISRIWLSDIPSFIMMSAISWSCNQYSYIKWNKMTKFWNNCDFKVHIRTGENFIKYVEMVPNVQWSVVHFVQMILSNLVFTFTFTFFLALSYLLLWHHFLLTFQYLHFKYFIVCFISSYCSEDIILRDKTSWP